MSVSTADAFFEVLEKSQLLTSEQFEQVQQQASASGDSKDVARWLIKKGLLSKWQAGVLLTGRHTLKFGKYTLVERLSSGDAGDVYLAKHEKLNRSVLLQTLPSELANDSDRVKPLLKEAREIAKLDHRNLIHVYDIGQEGDQFYLVMEKIDGQDLETIVREGGVRKSEVVTDYICQVAEGLAHAHNEGLVHRRINPANLLVDDQGTVKLSNLGLSQLAETSANGHSSTAGQFLAPEQKSGGEIDHRADIYSLGCTAMFLLTGKLPNALGPKALSQLEKIFRKMMAADPDERIQKAEHVPKVLTKWLSENQPASNAAGSPVNGNGPAAKPPPPKKKQAKPADSDSSSAGIVNVNGGARQPQPKAPTGSTPVSADGVPIARPAPKRVRKKNKSAGNGQFGGFGVGPKGSKTAASPASKQQASKGNDSQDLTKKKIPTTVIVGAAIGGVALLLMLGVGIVFALWMFSSSEPEVAKNDGTQAAADSTVDPEFDPEADFDPEEGIGNEPDSSGEDGEPDQVASNDTGTKTTDPDESTKTKDDPPTTKTTEPDKPPVPMPMTDPPKVDGNPDDKTKPPVKPADDPDKKPEVKPPDKPTPPKSTPPAAKPFAKLAKAVDLPELGDTVDKPVAGYDTPRVLGPVLIDENEKFFFVEMEGGEQAFRGKQEFAMRPARGQARQWEVFLKNPSKVAQPEIMVAKLWVEKQELKFQWTDQAPKDPASNHLCNCVLSVRTGLDASFVNLRKPVAAAPVEIDFSKSAGGTATVQIKWPPDPTAVHVQLLEIAGGKLPKPRFDPSPEMDAVNGQTHILLGDQNQQLFFRVDSKMTRNVQLTVGAYMGPNDPKPKKFNKKKLGSDLLLAQRQQAQLSQQLAQFSKLNKAQQAQAQLAYNQGQNNLKQLSEFITGMESVKNQIDEIVASGNNPTINFRVYYTAKDFEIELANPTGGPQAAVSPATKKP